MCGARLPCWWPRSAARLHVSRRAAACCFFLLYGSCLSCFVIVIVMHVFACSCLIKIIVNYFWEAGIETDDTARDSKVRARSGPRRRKDGRWEGRPLKAASLRLRGPSALRKRQQTKQIYIYIYIYICQHISVMLAGYYWNSTGKHRIRWNRTVCLSHIFQWIQARDTFWRQTISMRFPTVFRQPLNQNLWSMLNNPVQDSAEASALRTMAVYPDLGLQSELQP